MDRLDIGEWLRGIGLEQYEAAFRDNEIDGDILRTLTADDLKDLGVTMVGHRRKMLTAISELSVPSAPPPKIPEPASPAPTAELAHDMAERRQLTVMFCDLAGSTAMSACLDPEDMREIIRTYQDACSGVVARYDGFVAKFMGDGILAYFGFPSAHEDDAERAVRAGLEIAAAVPALQSRAPEPLKVRIGVATGVVVVGDFVGQGSAQEQAVVGETPNLADTAQRNGDVFALAELERLTGRLRKRQNRRDEARRAFDRAVEIARAQDAGLYLLRAGRDLAQLLAEEGEAQGAQDLLAPIVGGVTEHKTGLDYQESSALLASLAG